MSSKTPKKPSEHTHFVGVLVLFAGFSLYAITSFFTSTNDYLNTMYTSTLNSDQLVAVEDVRTSSRMTEEAVREPVKIFNDVDDSHDYYEAIEALYYAGLISGYPDGDFKPENTINRAEMLTVLTHAVDADLAGSGLSDCFTDVTSDWYAVYVCYAKQEGWVAGYADGSFKPAQKVNRAESLKIVLSAFNYELCDTVSSQPYNDVEVGAWYAVFACTAKKDHILPFLSDFGAGENMTRGLYSHIIYKTMKNLDLL